MGKTAAVRFGRRSRPKEPAVSPADPYAPHAARHAAFLEQARWLLGEQHRRSATFQQTAVALAGFDGVLLALLVNADTLGALTRFSTSWWAGMVAAFGFAVSAVFAVLALIPYSAYTVAAQDTLEAWAKHLITPDWDNSRYHFAHMLLAHDRAIHADAGRFRQYWRERLKLDPVTQPLKSAERMASRRARLAAASAATLLAGVLALVVVLFTSPITAGAQHDSIETPARGVIATPSPEN